MNKIKKTALAMVIAGFSLPAFAASVNLNTASKDEMLAKLDGLTPEQADAIIEYRKKQGAFVKVHELYHVGIGRDVISPNFNHLTVGEVNWGDKIVN